MKDIVVGILGGMGPEATAQLFMEITQNTKVKKDQDHYKVLINSNPKIPDRTNAIINNGESPVNEMIKTGKDLELLSPDFICMPCITAHYFYEYINESLDTPVLNLIDNLKNYIDKETKKIGVLSTTATKKTYIFNKFLEKYELIYPDDKMQKENVMEAIYGEKGIKNGYKTEDNKRLLLDAAEKLIEEGAENIILGCTELELLIDQSDLDVKLLRPLKLMAKTISNKEMLKEIIDKENNKDQYFKNEDLNFESKDDKADDMNLNILNEDKEKIQSNGYEKEL